MMRVRFAQTHVPSVIRDNMLQISIHLPSKYRLSVSLVKKRKILDEKPLLPNMGKVFRARKGNKLSRYFRILFENGKIKKSIGTNFALLMIASSLLPGSTINPDISEAKTISAPTILNTESGVRFPVKIIKITQGYRFYHPGLDLDGKTGDPIYPIMAGVVEKVVHSKFGYGKSIIVVHGGNTKSLYAHLSKIKVVEGQEVTKETEIGEMGATGRAFGDHLHLEIYENGKTINPLSVLR